MRYGLRTLLVFTCASGLALGIAGNLLIGLWPLPPHPLLAKLRSLDGKLIDRDGLLFGERELRESEWVSRGNFASQLPGVSLRKPNLCDADLIALKKLTGLWSISIKDGSGVTDNGLAYLAGASRLENLALFNTHITAAGLSRLPARERISTLWLAGPTVTDSTLADISDLPNLRMLSIRGSPGVTDQGMPDLAKLDHLDFLVLHQTSVTDRGLQHLSGLPELRMLNLQGAGISGAGMESLAGLVQLTSLRLDETNVGDDGLEWLGRLQNLRNLGLQPTPVTDKGLESLAKLRNLKHLTLGRNVSRAGAVRLKSQLPQCEIWFVEGNNWATLK
jgi:hypothetical protein